MFKSVIEQVQRLFSSKKNGGKLVYLITDRLHYFKVVLLFICILLLVGYSQFREHFQCDGVEVKDSGSVTALCWLNGTITVDHRSNRYRGSKTPHVGLGFLSGKNGKRDPNGRSRERVLNHSYMRFYWVLLMLMVFCSYIAQRTWSSIFNNDLLIALLQLPGHKESALVKSASEAQSYEKLVNLKREKMRDECMGRAEKSASLLQLEQVFDTIDWMTDKANIHNHLLDYYPNQLVHLLITKENSAYKLLRLDLRRKLFLHSICSTSFSYLQFLMPWLLFGPEYTRYGWRFLRIWLRYFVLQLTNPRTDINSINYQMSALIWPTVVNCEFRQYSYHGKLEQFGVQCTVAINDICAKMFAVIWWVVAISIAVELYSLFWATCYLLRPEFFLGLRFWAHARREAKLVARFRYRRARQIAQCEGYYGPEAAGRELKSCDEKRMSAGKANHWADDSSEGKSTSCARHFWQRNQVYRYLVERSQRRRTTRQVERLIRELYNDVNVYYLFRLLYMRLDRDPEKVEQIIRMCAEALENYLEFWTRFGEFKERVMEPAPAECQLSRHGGPIPPVSGSPLAGNKEAECSLPAQNNSKPDTIIDVNLTPPGI